VEEAAAAFSDTGWTPILSAVGPLLALKIQSHRSQVWHYTTLIRKNSRVAGKAAAAPLLSAGSLI
jgi:hypothetical protein